MTRLNLLLLLAVIASSLVLIRSAYDSRRLFAEIHRAELEASRLEGQLSTSIVPFTYPADRRSLQVTALS